MAGKKALVISGGAPNATLMSGALVAFEKQGVKFDVITTSGAGSLIGLLYVAPKGGSAIAALENTVNMGVSDSIYSQFPINYKVFNKPGVLADAYRNMLAHNPLAQRIVNEQGDNAFQRLMADMMQLMWASFCPSDLSQQSLGMCAHVPFVDQIVDFERLRQIDPHFYINAYNITRHYMASWGKDEITPDHFRAALSFPLIYPPYPLANSRTGEEELYIEGASIDCLNFKSLVEEDHGLHPELETLVVFDIMGADRLLRKPRDLYDAWVMSMITPLVEIAKDDLKLFELVHNKNPDGSDKRKLLKVPLISSVPGEFVPEMFDWSHSNLSRLYRIGFNAGLAFCRRHAVELEILFDDTVEPLPA